MISNDTLSSIPYQPYASLPDSYMCSAEHLAWLKAFFERQYRYNSSSLNRSRTYCLRNPQEAEEKTIHMKKLEKLLVHVESINKLLINY